MSSDRSPSTTSRTPDRFGLFASATSIVILLTGLPSLDLYFFARRTRHPFAVHLGS